MVVKLWKCRHEAGICHTPPDVPFRQWVRKHLGDIRGSGCVGGKVLRVIMEEGRFVLDVATWYGGMGQVLAYFMFDYYNRLQFNQAEDLAMASLSERLLKQKHAALKPTAIKDDAGRKSFPNLWDFLTTTEVAGEMRKPGTLNMFLDDGRFKAFLNDRESGLYAVCTASGLSLLLSEVEEQLRGDSLDWRVSKPFSKAKGK